VISGQQADDEVAEYRRDVDTPEYGDTGDGQKKQNQNIVEHAGLAFLCSACITYFP
jgi:hypothetical protein